MHVKERGLLVNILVPIVVGGLSGLLSMSGMKAFPTLNQPPFSPPGWVFPVVWTILYALMGYATYLVWNSEDRTADNFMSRESALHTFAVQLGVNFFWSIFFFNFGMFLFSFFWLIMLWFFILVNIAFYAKVRPLAGYLLIPYLLWVTFAGYLNFGVYVLNP